MEGDQLKQLAEMKPRTFTHKGMEVDEFVVYWTNGLTKLIWVRSSFITQSVDGQGVAVPLTHADFPTDDQTAEEHARQKVQRKFDEYYNL